MDMKVLTKPALLIACLITVGCGSRQETLDTQATEIVQEILATQAAKAPTNTPTNTPSPTVMPTQTKEPAPPPVIAFSDRTLDIYYPIIYVVNQDGSGLERLLDVFSFFPSSSPAWSQDGTRIAFTSQSGFSGDLWYVHSDGSELTQLTETADLLESCPTWSPNGNQIAYEMTEYSPSVFPTPTTGMVWRSVKGNGIWIMNVDGTQSFQIASSESFSSAGHVGCPSWSPDGKQIAFAIAFAVPRNQDIFLVNVDGTNLTQITIFANDKNEIKNVAWSPDGTRIAFQYGHFATLALDLTTQTSEADWQIYVVNLDGNELTQLTSIGTYNSCPSWTPDGAQILFNSDRDGNQEIYIMNADGSNQTRMFELEGNQFCPVWQPSP